MGDGQAAKTAGGAPGFRPSDENMPNSPEQLRSGGLKSHPGHRHSCGARWGGHSASHCPSCHRTFSCLSAFDAHRRNGVCHDPETLTSSKGTRILSVCRVNSFGTEVWGWASRNGAGWWKQ